MLSKVKAFLYAVTHVPGRILGLTADVGPFHVSLWVGREDPKAVGLAADVTLSYWAGFPVLDATVTVGVITVTLSLTKSVKE